MKESSYKDYAELPLFLNADTVAKALGVSPASGYELLRVVASSVSFTPPQAAGLIHSAAPPSPTKPTGGFAGTPLNFPSLRIGNRIVVPKEQFIHWVDEHTGGAI